jgi:hypothetical protein
MVTLLGCLVDHLYDFRRQHLGYKYSDFHLQTLTCELGGLNVTTCSEQLPRYEEKRVDLLRRIAWLL